MLLLHFSHVVGLILLLLTLASVIVFGTLRNSRKSMAPDREFLRELWRRGAWTAAAAAPAAALTIHYLLTNSGSAMGDRLSWRTLVVFLGTLSGPIACFSNRELLFSIPLAFLILGLSARALRMAFEHRAGDMDWTFLALAAAATALYLAAPDSSSGGSFLSRRLTLFPVLFLVFWVSQFPLGARAGRLMRVGLIACALGLTLIRIPSYAAFNRDLTEFLSCEAVLPQRATFIPLMLIRQSEGEGGTARSKHTWPLDSAADHLMSVKGRMDLAHYEGAMEGFYLKFRPEVDPSRYIGSYPAWAWLVPPECDFLSYSSRTPGRLDYVLLWGRSAASEETLRSASARSIFSQLENGYRKIFTSAPRGLMEVYERRR